MFFSYWKIIYSSFLNLKILVIGQTMVLITEVVSTAEELWKANN